MSWTDVKCDREQYKFRNIDDKTVVAVTNVLGEDENTLLITETTVTTSATEINVPSDARSYTIFHQSAGSLVHYNSDSSVTTSDPYLREHDVLKITGSKNFGIWMIAASGSVKVFVLTTTKE